MFVIWPLPLPPPLQHPAEQPQKLFKGNQLIMLLNHERCLHVRVRESARTRIETVKDSKKKQNQNDCVFFFSVLP